MSAGTLDRVTTPRMVLERMQPDHEEDLARLILDPRVSRTLWPRPEPPTREDVLASLQSKMAHWDRFGFGLWMMRDRHTGEMIGRGGLQETFVAGVHEVEAGWAIVPERWGEGLATELAHVSVAVAFDDLGLLRIVAFTRPDNLASRRVMEKSGFAFQRGIEFAGLPHVLYMRWPDEER